MSNKRVQAVYGSPKTASEANRWCQRALAIGERAAREEYYAGGRLKGG